MTYSSSAGAAEECARCGSARTRVIDGGFDEARELPRDLAAGDHATLVYSDPAQVAPFCARYLTEGVEAGEHVVAAPVEDLHRAMSELLAPEIEAAIHWEDPNALYEDFEPDHIAAKYEATIGGDDRTTRILAGLGPESAEEVDPTEFDRYERLSHSIITRLGANVVCLFDERFLTPELLAAAARRHGLAVHNGSVHRNESFQYAPA